jgi:hypothetical protein
MARFPVFMVLGPLSGYFVFLSLAGGSTEIIPA